MLKQCLLALFFSVQVFPAFATTMPAPKRVLTTDWTIAETMMLLGVTPIGLGQLSSYHTWVAEPQLPKSVVDIGLRSQPNRELIAELKPDLILISSFYATIEATLVKIAPIASITLYAPQDDIWHRLFAATREIAKQVGRVERGEQLLQGLTHQMQTLKQCWQPNQRDLLVVQFIDERHVRVFGKQSLFNAVIEQSGLHNAWRKETNYWGFSTAALEELMPYTNATLIVVDPIPVGIANQLKTSGLWPMIPAVAENHLLHMPPVWSFGGVASASRFANELSRLLPMQHSALCHESEYVFSLASN